MEQTGEYYSMYNAELSVVIEALKNQLVYAYKNGFDTTELCKVLKKFEYIRTTMIKTKDLILENKFELRINVVAY